MGLRALNQEFSCVIWVERTYGVDEAIVELASAFALVED